MSKSKKQQLPSSELWIGLAKVEQITHRGVLGDADRAYTNVIGNAVSKVSFRKSVEQELAKLGLKLIRLENAESLSDRLAKYSIDRELKSVAKKVASTQRIGFGTFHAFDVT
jgi:hypothetical protein